MRDVGRADEGESEAIGGVAGLAYSLTAQGKGQGVQGRVAAVPEECAVGLIGIEIAEVAASAKAAAPAAAEASASASTKASSSAEAASAGSAPAGTARATRTPGVTGHGCIAFARRRWAIAEVDAGEGVSRTILAGDGDGFGGDIGIGSERWEGCGRGG